MENILCVYHSGDNDGKFSGAVVKTAYPEAVCVGWNYGNQLSIAKLQIEHDTVFDTVIVCDLPLFQPIDEFKCYDNGKNTDLKIINGELTTLNTRLGSIDLLWFDHHIGNSVHLANKGIYKVTGRFDTRNSATKNVYDYFLNIGMISQDSTTAINLVDTYDCWKKEGGLSSWEHALAFNFATKNISFEEIRWMFFNNERSHQEAIRFINRGFVIKEQIETDIGRLIGSINEKIIDGHNWKFVNATSNKSYTADLLNDEKSVLSAWSYGNGKYWHSIRTKNPDVDLSEIAKKYGGGGHRAAAGFSTTERLHEVDK